MIRFYFCASHPFYFHYMNTNNINQYNLIFNPGDIWVNVTIIYLRCQYIVGYPHLTSP
jgi:hypothetical protein